MPKPGSVKALPAPGRASGGSGRTTLASVTPADGGPADDAHAGRAANSAAASAAGQNLAQPPVTAVAESVTAVADWHALEREVSMPSVQAGRGSGSKGSRTNAATTTRTGLTAHARLDEHTYPKGIKISDAQLAAVNLHGDPFHPEWNYTINPRGCAGPKAPRADLRAESVGRSRKIRGCEAVAAVAGPQATRSAAAASARNPQGVLVL